MASKFGDAEEIGVISESKFGSASIPSESIPIEEDGITIAANEEPAKTGVEAAFRKIPGFSALSEFSAAINRPVLETLDFLGPDTVNAVLSLGTQGVNKITGLESDPLQVPTLMDTIGSAGGFMDEGLARDVVRGAGEVVPMAAGVGVALRSLVSRLPALSSGGESVSAGTLRTLGSTTAGQDVALGAVSGAGGEVGEEIAGAPGKITGSLVAPLTAGAISPILSNTIKNIFRGGETGRQAVDESIQAFNVSGSTPTLGQSTGRPSLQAIESTSGKSPGGRPLRDQLDETSNNVQNTLRNMADNLSNVRGEEAAGRVIQRGIAGDDGFVSRFREQSNVLWTRLDDAIAPDIPVTTQNTTRALDNLVDDGVFGGILNNPQITQIRNALNESGGNVSYREIRDLRSLVGRRLSGNELISDIPRAELRQLYGALTNDIEGAARAQSPEALQAFRRANTYTRAGHTRLDDFVERINKKVKLEDVFRAVTRGGEGSQTINAFKRSLNDDEWNVVASNVIRKLGKATSGNQDDLSEAFSLNKFLTDWDKLGRAKDALFSGTPQLNNMRNDLNQIARTANRVKEASKELAGQSGTAQLAASIGTGGVATGALISGNASVAGSVLALVAANNGAARLMSSPRFVRWLAQTTDMGADRLGAQIAKLSVIAQKSDPEEARAISEFLEDAKGTQAGKE